MVEWEEQLPLKDYALRLPLWSAHKLPDILETYVKVGRAERVHIFCTHEGCMAWRVHGMKGAWHEAHGQMVCILRGLKCTA